MVKPTGVKILSVLGSPMTLPMQSKIPEGLRKIVDIPHKCGKLYKGKNLYGYYAYIY